MMQDLLRFVADDLSFLFDQGFKIVGSDHKDDMAKLRLSADAIQVEVVVERDERSARIRLAPSPEWFWIGVLRRTLGGERPGSDVLDADAAKFLKRHLPSLIRLGERERASLAAELVRDRLARASEELGFPAPPQSTRGG